MQRCAVGVYIDRPFLFFSPFVFINPKNVVFFHDEFAILHFFHVRFLVFFLLVIKDKAVILFSFSFLTVFIYTFFSVQLLILCILLSQFLPSFSDNLS